MINNPRLSSWPQKEENWIFETQSCHKELKAPVYSSLKVLKNIGFDYWSSVEIVLAEEREKSIIIAWCPAMFELSV